VAPTLKPLRIVFLAGPGDALAAFEYWKNGEENPAILSVGYSTQFYQVCHEVGGTALTISTHARLGSSSGNGISVENRGDPFAGKRGARYHLQHIAYAQTVLDEVRRFDANVLLIAQEPHPPLLSSLYRNDISVIQALHCPLWSEFGTISPGQRLLLQLMSDFYANRKVVVMSASADVTTQVRRLSGPQGCSVVEFFPSYRRESFHGIDPANHGIKPFRVFFAARIERAKGIFELLEMARRLHALGRTDILFDVCGDGSSFAELQRQTVNAGLQSSLLLHGWCEPDVMRQHLSRSHVVIVPTNREFGEGFNQVVVEGLLAGRPVLTSEVCPAVRYVRPAVLLHGPDDVDGYCRSIIQLADDQERYRALQSQAAPAVEKFLDDTNSYATALRHVLTALAEGRTPPSRSAD
jgi:glycogen(starch) synthase